MVSKFPSAHHELAGLEELGDCLAARHFGRSGQPAILKLRQCQRNRTCGPGDELADMAFEKGCGLGCGCGRRKGDDGGRGMHGTLSEAQW